MKYDPKSVLIIYTLYEYYDVLILVSVEDDFVHWCWKWFGLLAHSKSILREKQVVCCLTFEDFDLLKEFVCEGFAWELSKCICDESRWTLCQYAPFSNKVVLNFAYDITTKFGQNN